MIVQRSIVLYGEVCSTEILQSLGAREDGHYDDGHERWIVSTGLIVADFFSLVVAPGNEGAMMVLGALNIADNAPNLSRDSVASICHALETCGGVTDCDVQGSAEEVNKFVSLFASLVRGIVYEEKSFYRADGTRYQ